VRDELRDASARKVGRSAMSEVGQAHMGLTDIRQNAQDTTEKDVSFSYPQVSDA
jgi:hypothetical protein